MASLNNALDSIERHLDFPRSRRIGIARRMQESGILPIGAPGVAPDRRSSSVKGVFTIAGSCRCAATI